MRACDFQRMSCWYNRSKVSRQLIVLRTDWTPQLRHCTQRNERLKSHREQDACLFPIHIYRLYIIVRLRSKPWQLYITRHMLPIRSHALRKLHLLDFSLRFARDKSGVAFPRKPARIDSYFIQKNRTHTSWYRFCFFLTGSYLSSQAASSQVLSTYKGLTTVFGMGTGGSPQPSPPDYLILRALYPQNFHRRMNHLVLFVNHSQALDILVSVR